MWNIPITESEVHILIWDLLILFYWFILILFTHRDPAELLHLQLSFLCSAGQHKGELWHMQQKNFERLVTARKHVNYHLLDASSTFPLYFASLFLNGGIFLHQTSSSTAQSIPSRPACWTKERSHVLIVSLTLNVSIFWTHFILLWANGSSVKQLQGAKMLCLQSVCSVWGVSL